MHEAPRRLLRAVPGITFKDVDHVTQWSYCSGGGGGLPLPRTAIEVSEVVKLANRLRIPVVPRAGGTGLSDGAVPLRGGILVDVKL